MNPIFVFLVILSAFLVWLTFSFLYQPIGRFFGRLVDDAKEAMQDRTNETEDNESER